jgi:uncharacterized alkaline shock family protein YloU
MLPDVAAAVQGTVREYLSAMIDLDVRDVAVVIDDVAPAA